jgi:iron complex outermembrane receptor protein
VFNSFGDNSFEYEYKNQNFYQKNAHLTNNGFQQVFAFTKNNKTNFTGLVWYNESEKQIAPNINAANNDAVQKDKNLRTAITWQNKTVRSKNEIKLACFYDEIYFKSNDINASNNKSYTYNLSAEKNYSFNTNNSIHLGIINWLAFANVDGYNEQVNQNRLAAFLYFKNTSKNQRTQQQIGLRKELVNADFIPFMPSYYLQQKILKNILFKVNVATTYRLPTFNDLYWKNGGNLNLQSEHGWGADFAINHIKKIKALALDYTISLFYKTTENYIQWIPINSAIFSPINIGNVNARGIEILAKNAVSINKNNLFQLKYNGSFLQAIDTKTELQLIFTPRIKHVFNVIYNYKNLTIKYNHTYTGVSFTKSDLSEWNNDFEIGNLSISKTINFNNQNDLNIQLGINNIWNKSYQVMPDRPMPLRNFQLTLQYLITKK